MSRLKFDHIGLVVGDMAKGREFLESMFGIDRWTEVFEDPGIGVYVQFGRAEDGPCYELISPLGEASPVTTALKRGINILNHVAYLTVDLDRDARSLEANGSIMAGPPKPAVAYRGARVQFWITTERFMVELIEAPGHEHAYRIKE
ncbi:VOC family protein [Edaphobacter modestus]|uniref:Methylmalonyl-CoA/ethylmalonyl-CoA epimerase n=1 Tax=Edaphobacter modestus TaxID=388466 RepID=A0A4Q7YU14_9BACT|nr:VOC family protein [Edaphobacter modestus]RZU41332.1 methylmalonyl-CoA/ethylmalonyl-CoA epimerase [Edaphobacter modestus]